MRRKIFSWLKAAASAFLVMLAHPMALAQFPDINYPQIVKHSIDKSLPLLQSSATTFSERSGCISCHHQSLTSMAVALAQERGFAADLKSAQAQAEAVHKPITMLAPLFKQSLTNPAVEKKVDRMLIDPSPGLAYLMTGLAASHVKPDSALQAAVLYLARKQCADGRWPVLEARPPLEASEFTVTALAVRVLQTYAPAGSAPAIGKQIAKARAWLLATTPKTTEDRAFRLLGLAYTQASLAEQRKAAKALLALQQDDGGWSQLPGLPTDAYATGQALVALNLSGSLPKTDSAYQRGYKLLLKTQQEDGSWHVQKRAIAVQPYFESGFPHKADQFISISGSAWATMALALTAEAPSHGTASVALAPIAPPAL